MLIFARTPNAGGSLCILLFIWARSLAAADDPGSKWKVASPESQGLDSAVLAEAVDYVRAKRIPLHSFLIVRSGVMVLDAYFWPYQGREVHDVASVTKSFLRRQSGWLLTRVWWQALMRRLTSSSHRPETIPIRGEAASASGTS
jgi:hypothetical protein